MIISGDLMNFSEIKYILVRIIPVFGNSRILCSVFQNDILCCYIASNISYRHLLITILEDF